MVDLHHTIERIKHEQPKAVRQQYAFLGAVLVTLVIVGFWSLSVPARLAILDMKNQEATVTAPSVTETNRWQNLAAGIASLFKHPNTDPEGLPPAIPAATSNQSSSTDPSSWGASVRAHQSSATATSARTVLIATTSRSSSTTAATSTSSVLQ